MTNYLVLPPEGGEQLMVRGSTLLFKAVAETTGGAFSLHERHVPAGGRRPPPHVHPDRVEAFWVLSGAAEFELDGQLTSAGAGSFVLVPGGVAHTFGAGPAGPARLLVLHAPALDGYFRELADLWSGEQPPARDEELSLMRRHGMQPVDRTGSAGASNPGGSGEIETSQRTGLPVVHVGRTISSEDVRLLEDDDQ